MWECTHLKSKGEAGQWGRKSGKGWQRSFKKSLQHNTLSLVWLKLVPHRTGALISVVMYFSLCSKGRSKNFPLTSLMLLITSSEIPWFISCINQTKWNWFYFHIHIIEDCSTVYRWTKLLTRFTYVAHSYKVSLIFHQVQEN